jgi:predicted nuclease of predicted toxin-antitoxin system
VLGHPPKVVWIRRGNCSTAEIEAILRARYDELLSFERDGDQSFLALS